MQTISDQSGTGLTLIIQPKRTDGKPSAKTYWWRGSANGKALKIKIGRAETMKCTAARNKAIEISNSAKDGEAPAPARQRIVVPEVKIPTVSEVFSAYMAQEGRHRKSAKEKQRIFDREIKPTLGALTMAEVTQDALAKLVNDKAKTAPVQANRLQALLSRFFRWSTSSVGWSDSMIRVNPMMGVIKPTKVTVRKRVLKKHEVVCVLKACRQISGMIVDKNRGQWGSTRQWAMAIETLLRTGQRRSDILGLTHEEIEDGIATLSGERHKSGEEHKIVLPMAMIEMAGTSAGRVFPTSGNEDTHIKRVRARVAKIAKEAGFKMEHWTLHDLRRTVATTLKDMVDEDERSVASSDDIKKLLGHALQGAIAAYLHEHALPMKKRVMRVWNAHLDTLLS